ncbi:MAG: hypothetical protein EZS28_031289, partial [Streblomastix strix]
MKKIRKKTKVKKNKIEKRSKTGSEISQRSEKLNKGKTPIKSKVNIQKEDDEVSNDSEFQSTDIDEKLITPYKIFTKTPLQSFSSDYSFFSAIESNRYSMNESRSEALNIFSSTSYSEPLAVMKKIQATAQRGQIRLYDFFRDFDTMHYGVIFPEYFRTGFSNAQ